MEAQDEYNESGSVVKSTCGASFCLLCLDRFAVWVFKIC